MRRGDYWRTAARRRHHAHRISTFWPERLGLTRVYRCGWRATLLIIGLFAESASLDAEMDCETSFGSRSFVDLCAKRDVPRSFPRARECMAKMTLLDEDGTYSSTFGSRQELLPLNTCVRQSHAPAPSEHNNLKCGDVVPSGEDILGKDFHDGARDAAVPSTLIAPDTQKGSKALNAPAQPLTYILQWENYATIENHRVLMARALSDIKCLKMVPGFICDNPDENSGGESEGFDVQDDLVEREVRSLVSDGDGSAMPLCCYSWQWVNRPETGSASTFPRDFSLVRLAVHEQSPAVAGLEEILSLSKKAWKDVAGCSGDEEERVARFCKVTSMALATLRASPHVKAVYQNQALTRGIAAVKEQVRARGGFSAADSEGRGSLADNVSSVSVAKKSGADSTAPGEGEVAPKSFNGASRDPKSGGQGGGKLRGSARKFVDAARQAKPLHDKGYRGAGIRVGVFDTGLEVGGYDFDNVVERINWTDDDTLTDAVGHGTHITGVIGGRDPLCPGFAPDAELYVFRVFSSEQVSYTSWFLDAFNYALFLQVDVVNLSIGGPDFRDEPFVDKIRELSANGVMVVSAVGNDGPVYGTQHNPADQSDTIGVGALTSRGDAVASFQSRGMTTWELPGGYGRVKPDLLAVGQHVLGPTAGGIAGQCSGLSGTSVASPVVAGAVALLASSVPAERRSDLVNPASMKQVLVESARRIKGSAGVFEQGAGALDVVEAYRILQTYEPRASLLPPSLDLTDPYMWPFSRQPLYYGSMPVIFNLTVANGMGVIGHIENMTWREEEFFFDDAATGASHGAAHNVLDVRTEYADVLWPWSGYLALSLSVSDSSRDYKGIVQGTLEVTVTSEAGMGDNHLRSTVIPLPVTASVIRTPPRERRLLWDQYHNLPYPPAFSPRDDLGDESDMLDRLGDHPHTNFRTLFGALLDAGYFVEVLGDDWECFDADQYGALLLIDLEKEAGEQAKQKLERDVKDKGLSLVIFADWYSQDVMTQVHFVDDNTRMPWKPITGGSNIPAMNDFLFSRFGLAFGGTVLDGAFDLPGGKVHFASGNALARVPPGGIIVSASPGSNLLARASANDMPIAEGDSNRLPLIGALDTNRLSPMDSSSSAGTGGRLFLFGDSSCADDAALRHLERNSTRDAFDCFWLFKAAVRYACEGYEDPDIFNDALEVTAEDKGDEVEGGANENHDKGYSDGMPLPRRPSHQGFPGQLRAVTRDRVTLECDPRPWRIVPTATASRT